MQHIDEHTIELYVLGSDLVKDRRDEIEAHFRECHGCRSLAEQMQAFYTTAKENVEEFSLRDTDASKALIRSRRDLEPYYEPYAPPIPYRPNTIVGKFTYLIRRHPVAVGATGFAILSSLLIGVYLGRMSNVTHSRILDTNPAYTAYDLRSNMLVVYNKEDSIVWEKKSAAPLQIIQKQEDESQLKKTVLADLDGDGVNEVLTTTKLAEDAPSDIGSLKAFGGDKILRFKVAVEETINYRSRHYDPRNGMEFILAEDLDGDRKSEIFVTASNMRSPCLLVRLSARGQIVGEYFHFGGITCETLIDLDGDRRKKMIIGGTHDLGDTVDNENTAPFIAVLDPLKIQGKARSTSWIGLQGIQETNAELYYIVLPRTNIDKLYHTSPILKRINRQTANQLEFLVSTMIDNVNIDFRYYFDPSMNLLGVQSSDNADRLYNTLVDKGLLSGKIDSVYLANLKNKVLYWDGREWKKEAVKIHSPTP